MRQRRLLIYLAPALMDMVLAQFFFVDAVRLARMGASASIVAGIVTVWGVVYLLSCPLVGKVLTVANSTRLIIAACLIMACVCILHLFFTSVRAIYVLMACVGIMTALFFPAFQVFMKAVDTAQASSIAYSTGMYTFAWSMGFAVGPFVAGFLLECGGTGIPGSDAVGWKLAILFGAVVSVMTAGLIALLKHLRTPPAATQAEPVTRTVPLARPALDYTRLPDLVWLGWLGAGIGVLVLSVVRGVFPARAETVLGLSAGVQGTLFFLLSLAQALVGLANCRSKWWMYRAWPLALFGLAGTVGTLCLGYGKALPVLAAGAILFGLYSGAFFFYLVFHALAHPTRSARYIAVNESVVGIGGIAGPLLGGFLADRAGFGPAYLTGAGLIIVAITVQIVALQRRARKRTIPSTSPCRTARTAAHEASP